MDMHLNKRMMNCVVFPVLVSVALHLNLSYKPNNNAFAGLKTVVSEVDASKGNQVCTQIIPKLLTTVQNVMHLEYIHHYFILIVAYLG